MKRILTVITGLFFLYAAQGQELQKEVVYFDSNKDNLKPSEQQKLDDFLIDLGDLSKIRFGIYGYTDSRGSMEYNLALSQRRSETVLKYLLAKGISVDNAIIDHFGELSPIIEEEENATDMAQNRRVEIKAFAISPPITASSNPKGFKEHPLVKPILPHLAKEREVFSISTDEEISLETENGTIIHIPANALVDAMGNPIEGQVDISYRDYHDPVEVLLSGIPMTFDSGGVVNQFQTAGMFELEAAQNGQPVFLKDGEQIDIELQSMDENSNYNFYALDDESGWENVGTAPATTSRQTYWGGMIYCSEAYRHYMQGTEWRDRFLAELDTSEFSKTFNDDQYFYTHHQTKMGDLRTGYKFRSGKRSVLVRKHGYLKVRTVRRVRGDEKDVVRFTIQQIATPKTHPEMRAFNNTYWKFAVRMDRGEFRKTFSYKKKYSDMRVVYNDGDRSATLELKGPEGILSFEVYPYQADMGQETMDPEAFGEQYARYEKLLARRGKKFDKIVARGNSRIMRKHNKSVAEFNKNLDRLMTDEEKAMEFDEWLSFSAEQTKILNADIDKAQTSSYTLTRSLTVDGFGIYNCDQIYRLQSPVEVIANYNDKDKKKKIPWQTTYVVDANLRGVLTYYNNPKKDGKITFDPETTQAIIACNDDGELAFIRSSQMNDYYRNKDEYEFDMKAISSVTSVAEFKAMLGLIN